MTGDPQASRTATAAPRARRPSDETGPDRSAADPDDSGADPPDPYPPSDVPGPAGARALVRVQLRIALRTGAVVLAVLAGLPALLALVPAVARVRVDGVPMWWAVLAAGLQPLWAAAALWQLSRAERAERPAVRSGQAGRGSAEYGSAEYGEVERGAAGPAGRR